ncbi:P-loop NTPase family protein [Jiangella endophytica]|uniref:hypothetical protein n=1 Tax=Jiangella endophytica TaxID=1623398 RepID=UPI000E34C2F5|nr:hypothetical protein [Jiangella endophytica]
MAQRIQVIGAAGSGKTTLARQLAARIGVEALDLDSVIGRDAVELRQACERFAAEPAWVCEGIYCGWTDPLLRAADRIIWLDLPPVLSAYRIIRRHVRNSVGGNNPHKGVRLLVGFTYDAAWRYFHRPVASDDELARNPGANSRATVDQRLRPYASKVIHVRTRTDVRRLSDLIEVSDAPID